MTKKIFSTTLTLFLFFFGTTSQAESSKPFYLKKNDSSYEQYLKRAGSLDGFTVQWEPMYQIILGDHKYINDTADLDHTQDFLAAVSRIQAVAKASSQPADQNAIKDLYYCTSMTKKALIVRSVEHNKTTQCPTGYTVFK